MLRGFYSCLTERAHRRLGGESESSRRASGLKGQHRREGCSLHGCWFGGRWMFCFVEGGRRCADMANRSRKTCILCTSQATYTVSGNNNY